MNATNLPWGIAFIAAAVGCFAAMDITTKVLAAAAVPALMAVWCRNALQLAIVGITLVPRRGRAMLHTGRPMLQCLRGALLMGTSLCGFIGVKLMPVGEFTAIVLITPLALTLLSALASHERVLPLRGICVAGGFVGAMMVVRPAGEEFGAALLLPLGIVGTNTGYQWLTSRLAQTEDPGTMQLYTGVVGTLLATLALPFAWQPLSAAQWALALLIGVLGTTGHFLLILGYARAPVGMLTPYLYLQIAFATLGGWLVFSHAPDAWSAAGIALIAASGVWGTWLAKRQLQRGTRIERKATCSGT
jgi:drug/metabolite transporter (DMT)-like permease